MNAFITGHGSVSGTTVKNGTVQAQSPMSRILPPLGQSVGQKHLGRARVKQSAGSNSDQTSMAEVMPFIY